ncbi:DUF1127 domain-containing protein [Sinorhizobium mexicanum]|uniref:DUF1127 domain-containing protein n=1 Tax=Sinorhizobium mexicanum TaxID=375549 RepID=A0A859QRR0_9HYPH|nr:DUF1127 domain-containing protein [Sinorhizobium mexicanum]MBP1882460.1 uncharacterized protein YjiS (DUF1127 family) [Sinorhizobium mexicanum]QLL62149.1 DUF1127 domain-containing protein [Sinorhizobium mexicanum]
MSATLSTIDPSQGSRLIFSVCRESIARHFVRRAALKALREFDDDALRDIGLARSEIEAAVYGFMTSPKRART